MRALTLWRPWDQAILHGGKRVENRPWRPWRNVIGHNIAVHAGLKYDVDGVRQMRELGLCDPPAEQWCPSGAIVGVARVMSFVTDSDDPWFSGPVGWLLDDVVAFDMPVACRGAQGLWEVPSRAMEKVRREYAKAIGLDEYSAAKVLETRRPS